MLTPLDLMTIYFKLVMLERYYQILCTYMYKINNDRMFAILILIELKFKCIYVFDRPFWS